MKKVKLEIYGAEIVILSPHNITCGNYMYYTQAFLRGNTEELKGRYLLPRDKMLRFIPGRNPFGNARPWMITHDIKNYNKHVKNGLCFKCSKQ